VTFHFQTNKGILGEVVSMKTFYQFFEAIEKHELEDGSNPEIETILLQIKDKRDVVKFALYCAKDCFRFNDNTTRTVATNCINLVRKWLKNPESVTSDDLLTAANNVVDVVDDVDVSSDAVYAAYAAHEAARCVANATNTTNTVYGIYVHSASDAANAFYYANNEDESIRQQKENEYKSYALSLLRSSNLMYKDENEDKEVEKQRNSFTNQFFSKKSKLTNRFNIMGLLDILEERGEDLVQHIGNELHLNIPNGITITAKDKNELVDKIWKNKAVLHYLEKLYR
jgi:hypothetical protein